MYNIYDLEDLLGKKMSDMVFHKIEAEEYYVNSDLEDEEEISEQNVTIQGLEIIPEG